MTTNILSNNLFQTNYTNKTYSAQGSAKTKVASGLRVAPERSTSPTVSEPDSSQLSPTGPKSPAVTESAATENSAASAARAALTNQFGSLIAARLENVSQVKDPKSVANLQRSLVATAEKIDQEFDSEAAHQFRLAVLAGLEGGVDQTRLTYYISDFFVELSASEELTPTFKTKLDNVNNYLNEGLDNLSSAGSSDQNQKDATNLAYALNSYFAGNSDQLLGADSYKKFATNFHWVTVSKTAANADQALNSPAEDNKAVSPAQADDLRPGRFVDLMA